MQLNTDLLKGVAQAATKLELALVYVKNDSDLTITSVNESFSQIAKNYRLPIDSLFLWLKNERYSTTLHLFDALKHQDTLLDETLGRSPAGDAFHIQWSVSAADDGGLVCCIRDIRWRQKYKDQWTLFERVFDSGRASIVVTDENNRIVMANRHFEEISGYSKYEVLGQDPGCFSSGRQSKAFYKELWRTLQQEGYWTGVVWNKRKDGREYPEHKTIYAVTNEHGVLTHYFSSGEILPNVGEAPQQREFSDGLISQQALITALNEHRRQQLEAVAVYHIGVDRMDQANRVCGLSFGDHILQILLARLKDTFLPNGLIARSIGDEFIVASPNISTPDIANSLGQMLLQSLNSTIRYDDIEWNITASIGISFFARDNDAWKAIEQAHIAMHHAKSQGGDNLQFYDTESQNSARESLRLEQALRYAIENDELSLHYQPLIALNDQHVFGAEALLRWHSSEFGFVGPDRFIPIAEQSDLILDIGLWVFQTACCQLKQWGSEYAGSVAINLSAQQIQYADLPNKLLTILRNHDISVDRIHLEITETAMINDTNSAVSVVSSLREAGFTLSMDDFGTGYSSLSYLTRFPIDKLKVDRSFIDTITTNSESLVVTKSIISLAKSLGLKVVAEGVETEGQLKELGLLNCDYAQGYLFSRPLAADDFIQFYQQQCPSIETLTPHLLSVENAS